MPEYVEFVPMPPPGFEEFPLSQVIAFFERRLEAEERKAARKRRGARVWGIEYCESLRPTHRPGARTPLGELNPRFSCRSLHRLIRVLRREREFRQEHQRALRRYRRGRRDAAFPSGTRQMATLANVAEADEMDPRQTQTDWSAALQRQWNDWMGMCRRAA